MQPSNQSSQCLAASRTPNGYLPARTYGEKEEEIIMTPSKFLPREIQIGWDVEIARNDVWGRVGGGVDVGEVRGR